MGGAAILSVVLIIITERQFNVSYGQASCCLCKLSSVVPSEPMSITAVFQISLLAFPGAVEGT